MRFTLRIDGVDVEAENQAERDILRSWQDRVAHVSLIWKLSTSGTEPDAANVRFERSA
jgi:hypothetical protein